MKYFVYTEACHQVSIPLTKSSSWIENKKYPTKDQFAIYCGPTQMIELAGELVHVALVIPSVKI